MLWGISVSATALHFDLIRKTMYKTTHADVLIVGGSFAGLSAGMALGRALRKTVIIDSGMPCNRQTPHSHNFITHDGRKPADISADARAQVLKYDTVSLVNGIAEAAARTEQGFRVTVGNEHYEAKKLILATGVHDVMPDIDGFAASWGISVIHCPYCHGYEVRGEKTGILANGMAAFDYARLISNWTKDLVVFTNGRSELTDEQHAQLNRHNISVIETPVVGIEHEGGYVHHVALADNTRIPLKALYSRVPFKQSSGIAGELGCALTEQGLIKVDMFQQTSVSGVFACGDSASMVRAVAQAVATGNMAGAVANRQMIEEMF